MKNLKALSDSWKLIQELQASVPVIKESEEIRAKQIEQIRLLKLGLAQRLITKN